MPNENIRRHKRNPLTPEEVAEIVALKERRAHLRLHRFKRSRLYKTLNIFCVLSFFVHCELLICFFGPCRYERHVATQVQPNYGSDFNEQGRQIVNDLEVTGENSRRYIFVVKDFIPVPAPGTEFFVGEDYLLRRELKGVFDDEDRTYRLFRASPIVFLSLLALAACVLGFLNNLNEHPYSLTGIAVVNVLTLLAILCY